MISFLCSLPHEGPLLEREVPAHFYESVKRLSSHRRKGLVLSMLSGKRWMGQNPAGRWGKVWSIGGNLTATRHQNIQVDPSFFPPHDAVVQKVQEISSTFPAACIFGDPRPYCCKSSRFRRNAGPEHLSRRCAPFDPNPRTGGADLVVVAGVNNGGGSRITLLDRGDEDQQLHASGASTRTPGREDGATSECALHSSSRSRWS